MRADLDTRARQIAEAIGLMTPPVKPVTLNVWAMRQGWEREALEPALVRARELGLLEEAEAAPAAAPALEPAPVAAAPALLDEKPAAVEQARPSCLCARTWPQKNYGCPEHGGARINAKQETTTMAKQWISTTEAAELLECTPRNVSILAAGGKITSRRTGEGPTSPLEVNRASVILHRDAKRKAKADRDLLPATPTKRKASAPKHKAPAKASASGGELVLRSTPIEGSLVEAAIEMTEIRALVRIVGRAGIDKVTAWDWLVKLVA